MTSNNASDTIPKDLIHGIATYEGFYRTGNAAPTRAQRNNNPGNVQFGKFATMHGSDGVENTVAGVKPRFAHFPTSVAGFDCLRQLLNTAMYCGHTLRDAIAVYAPSVENSTDLYLEFLCGFTGASPDTIITPELIG